MKKILIVGAGRSATALINYLLEQADAHGWQVVVADFDKELAERKVGKHPSGKALRLNVRNVPKRRELVAEADVVVSLLPVGLHYLIVRDCLKFKTHLVTASYLTNEMLGLDAEARDNAILMMGEMGLDPGIDHMSAMKTLAELRRGDRKITGFRSYTGGLIAPESIDNPWSYKFTWNPWNVVTAGKSTAQYLFNGNYKYIPYNRVFAQAHEVEVDGVGTLEAYINRDSLLYKSQYGLDNVPTLMRCTLRYPGYCKAWNALVQLGLTDDSYPIIDIGSFTYRKLVESYLAAVPKDQVKNSTEERLRAFLASHADSDVLGRLEWLGLLDDERINLKNASPAEMLLDLLLRKWSLKDDDKDMVVMHHVFEYEEGNEQKQLTSTLLMKGENRSDTAMSRLVGLPLGIFVKLLMLGKIEARGVHIPVMSEFYEPVLEELEEKGVRFVETEGRM